MSRKIKIEVSEGLTSILNYITSAESFVLWSELVQYCIDYDLYKDLYIHLNVVDKLVNEHNRIKVNEYNKIKQSS